MFNWYQFNQKKTSGRKKGKINSLFLRTKMNAMFQSNQTTTTTTKKTEKQNET